MKRRLAIAVFIIAIYSITSPRFQRTAFSQPNWLNRGTYVEYSCNVSVYKGAPYAPTTGTFKWTIINLTDGYVYILYEMRIEDMSFEKTFKIDTSSNQIKAIDDKIIENTTNYLWMNYAPRIGDTIQLENLSAVVVDLRLVSSKLFTDRACWLTNATFTINGVNMGDLKNATMDGFIERSYDCETGVLVSSRFLIEFKDSRGSVSQSYFSSILISSTNIPNLTASRQSSTVPVAVAVAILLTSIVMVIRRILQVKPL
ncbi:hypothetical protein KEJ27_06550 [Candidatus Bathyarchaeota archaeon]|nr:hypothetical protein [Candidatus Bathyarchaeota archaeon]MBS7612770.1 hypothetical protein [Candidatus Bathyarchaeota archaeon]MBS7618329.1 hypothetical protein [Candidatus Bathyarchaeota archaeon]